MAELFRAKGGTDTFEANLVASDTVTVVAIWCGGVEVVEHDVVEHNTTYAAINVPTVAGMKRAQEGDWIIRRPAGDFYPVTSERFSILFEAAVNGN